MAIKKKRKKRKRNRRATGNCTHIAVSLTTLPHAPRRGESVEELSGPANKTFPLDGARLQNDEEVGWW